MSRAKPCQWGRARQWGFLQLRIPPPNRLFIGDTWSRSDNRSQCQGLCLLSRGQFSRLTPPPVCLLNLGLSFLCTESMAWVGRVEGGGKQGPADY